jgi:hypothetical protein
MDVGAELKGKVGPFPLYVWLLIMTGLGLVAYLVLGKKKKGAATGTPGTPCTQSDGSAGTWDSTGTVCQATTVSTVNAPTAGTISGQGSSRNWRSSGGTATSSPVAPPPTTGTGTGTTTNPPPTTTTPPVSNPITPVSGSPSGTKDQVGTVYSNTTKETGSVASSDGGKTWTYIGVPAKKGQPKSQTGTVSSQTTGLTAKVTTSNAGATWVYAG